MSRQKPRAWLLWRSSQSYHLVSNSDISDTERWLTREDGRKPRREPLYRRSPTHKEEQVVVRAAVAWRDDMTDDQDTCGRLVSAVDRLLAKRKKAKP